MVVHGDKQADRRGEGTTGMQQEAAEGVLLIEVGNGVFGPELHAGGHGDKVHGRVNTERCRHTVALQDAPEDVCRIVRQHREEERSVRAP